MIEHRIHTLTRDVESSARSRAAGGSDGLMSARSVDVPIPIDPGAYVGFEDRFRGSPEEIRARARDYVPLLASANDVVDLGCGRGELLDLLREHSVRARGVDGNPAMVALCRARGLDVEEADALSFLERQPDESIGALAAIQVVEHFKPAYLIRVLETARAKMRGNSPLLLETINPACWMAFFETYIRDPTHQRPLHPETLKYLVEASGFTRVDIQFRQPISERDRLARVPEVAGETTFDAGRIAAAVNDHADKLNARLFSSTDYVLTARRP
jgi:O-antigen chain-terminating methyltransferase